MKRFVVLFGAMAAMGCGAEDPPQSTTDSASNPQSAAIDCTDVGCPNSEYCLVSLDVDGYYVSSSCLDLPADCAPDAGVCADACQVVMWTADPCEAPGLEWIGCNAYNEWFCQQTR